MSLDFTDNVKRKDGMASTRVFVHFMRSTSSVFHSFQQNRNHIINVATIDNNEVLNEKPVGGVPAAMKDSRLEVKQIFDLFVVDFSVRGFDGILAFVLFDFFPEFLDCPWNDTLSFIGFVDFAVVDLVFSSHGVGFS